MNNFCKKRTDSFKYAFQGAATLFHETPNAIIHLIMAILGVLLGFIFSISATEWLAIIIVIGLVFALEAVNTSIESLADFVSKERNESIKKVKDLAAASVLIASMAALAIGILVFLPKIIELF
ncbi:MAG TPA: diacylglycerol kinase family protein [Petrimonas sp.]|uniref:diacylglycerol kinase family protein n=1 Tax=Petrimonas sp. TaxID=2023866 RepID=UPI00096135D6|nr:MAG: diacylglycerol kinase [Bacteroidia bacterium 43-41]HHV86698.1 diacylglycerol kinase family protein [Petrimonas sp.]